MFRHSIGHRIKVMTVMFPVMAICWVAGSSVTAQQMEKRHTQLYRQRAFVNSFPTIGQQAPDIEVKTIDGQPVKLSDYFGKPLVLIKGSYT